MPTERRMERLKKAIAREVSEVLMKEMKDPRLISMVSVVDVDITPDLSHVMVRVSLFGGSELDNLKTLEALNHGAGFISSVVSKNLRLRFAPRFSFEKTDSIEKGVDMYFKIKELSEDIEEHDENTD